MAISLNTGFNFIKHSILYFRFTIQKEVCINKKLRNNHLYRVLHILEITVLLFLISWLLQSMQKLQKQQKIVKKLINLKCDN